MLFQVTNIKNSNLPIFFAIVTSSLQARAIANDYYRFILETNAGIVSDALKFLTQSEQEINTLQKLDERIEAIKEETTTEDVY